MDPLIVQQKVLEYENDALLSAKIMHIVCLPSTLLTILTIYIILKNSSKLADYKYFLLNLTVSLEFKILNINNLQGLVCNFGHLFIGIFFSKIYATSHWRLFLWIIKFV